MSKVCMKWTLEDLCEMSEQDMDALLQSYEAGGVPSFDQVRVDEKDGGFVFDGSFGWSL